jgi:hypothetical protein
MKVTVVLSLKKSTKGTHVYGNEDKGIPNLYFPKEMFDGEAPKTISMTLESK